jgi:hypothetical protein
VALLRVGELHVQLFKARFGRHAALLQVAPADASTSDKSPAICSLRARGLLGQLRQAQRFDLQLVCALLGFGGFASRADQALAGIAVGGLGLDQGVAGFFADEATGRAAGSPGSRSPAHAPASPPARNRARRS